MIKYSITLTFLVISLIACRNQPVANSEAMSDKKEMVDNGYVIKNTRSSSGSGTSFEIEDENMLLENYLRKVAGVSVSGSGNNARVTIRGVKSINLGPQEPLFVIDGVPVEGGLSNAQSMVQVRDIDRVTVLKDGSSTAIYGMRGSNGVIVIRTKKQ